MFVAKLPWKLTCTISLEKNILVPSTCWQNERITSRFNHSRKFTATAMSSSMFTVTAMSPSIQCVDLAHSAELKNVGLPIMVNGCTGKMGRAVLEAAITAGLNPVSVALGGPQDTGQIVEVNGKLIEVHGPPDREKILSSTFATHPDLIVVDYTAPSSVNENTSLYCKIGVPFVLGTTGGDRELLCKTVEDSKVYAVISPQMGKQVVAFLAGLEYMAEQFPGAFSGYTLEVMESHQAGKLDISGTAEAAISCFQKLGVSFELDQVTQLRDPKLQTEMIGVPEEHLSGHAFHTYHLTSPDGNVSLEYQHNVCGRSIYANGTVDAILFLAKKVKAKSSKRIFDMIDVLREGNLR